MRLSIYRPSKFTFLRRLYSTKIDIPQLIRSSNIDAINEFLSSPQDLQSHSPDEEISSVLSDIFNQIKDSERFTNDEVVGLHNLVLSNYLPLDRSLSMIHQNQLKRLQGAVSLSALTEIMRFNSGRVHTSWELFESYYKGLQLGLQNAQEVEKLLTLLLEKLIYGDENTIAEEGYEDEKEQLLSPEDLVKCVFILKNLNNVNDELSLKLFNRALELKDYQLAHTIGIETLETFGKVKFNDLKDEVFTYHLLTSQNPDLQTQDLLSSLLLKFNASSPNELVFDSESALLPKLAELNVKFPEHTVELPSTDLKVNSKVLFDKLSQTISESPTSNATKVKALKSLGFNECKVSDLLKLHHEFIQQTQTEHEINDLNNALTLALTYQYLTTPTPEILCNIQKLKINSIKVLQSQIILLYRSSALDQALDLYNGQISNLSKAANESGLSDASELTETLVVVHLLSGDREFANLIHDGAIMNEIIQTEAAKSKVKKEFKRYGDVFGEEDKSKVKDLVESWAKDYVKGL